MTQIIKLNKKEINEIDLSELNKYIEWNTKNFEYFNLEAGKEHYKIIAYLTGCMNNDKPVCDIGTYFGFSALALAFYSNSVITYDICDWIPDDLPDEKLSIKQNKAIKIKIMNCCNDMEEIVKSNFIVLDIDPHDGLEEIVIIKALQNAGFQGLLLLDDINLNDDMKKFWNSITLPKIDVTDFGHWSGTGIVLFGDLYEIILS